MATDSLRPTGESDHLSASLASLRAYLSRSIETGIQLDELRSLLIPIWALLDGSSRTSMEAHKLSRMAAPVWAPPLLKFEIERHGAMKFGSGRAERQCWSLNTENGQLTQTAHGYVQKLPRDKPLNVRALVAEIVNAVSTGAAHKALASDGADSLTISVGVLIPEGATPKQTLQGRRSRFRAALVEEMNAIGWDCAPRSYRFQRKSVRPR